MKPVQVDKCLELDQVVKDCELHLYTCKMDYSFLSHLFMGWGIHRRKWYLVAQFPQKDTNITFTFYAEIGQDGKIEGYRMKDVTPEDPVEKIFIGSVRISPKELLNIAQKHPYNKTSAPILAASFKCQDWINEFARMISPNLKLP